MHSKQVTIHINSTWMQSAQASVAASRMNDREMFTRESAARVRLCLAADAAQISTNSCTVRTMSCTHCRTALPLRTADGAGWVWAHGAETLVSNSKEEGIEQCPVRHFKIDVSLNADG